MRFVRIVSLRILRASNDNALNDIYIYAWPYVQDKSKEAYKVQCMNCLNNITRFYSLCLTKNDKVQIDTHGSKPTKRIKHTRIIKNSLAAHIKETVGANGSRTKNTNRRVNAS
jgi:hypothetical protein